jgi:transglutaminase-like putative cysteine protease
MRLDIEVAFDYEVARGDAALLAITVAQTDGQTVLDSALEVENASLRWIDGQGGVGRRVWATPEAERLQLYYRAKVDVTRPDVDLDALAATPWHALPDEVIAFLRPSRFCPSDLLTSFVRSRFGHLEGGEKVAAIRDWTEASLAYVAGSSGATTTAVDTFVSREGVCRDYAHLVCGLARAANIPARYTTGYGPDVSPPDFHAVAEVWLDGAWHLVDATGMSSAGGLVVIGSGRDAGDVAFLETEHWASLVRQEVGVTRR